MIAAAPTVAGFVPATVLAIWLASFGVACLVLAGLAAVTLAEHRREHRREAADRPDLADVQLVLADVEALRRHAATAADAAAGAAHALAEAQARCRAVQQARETAWQEYDAAQPAAAVPAPRTPAVPATVPAGDPSTLLRAALIAYRRGDISVDQLRDVFGWSTGWSGEYDRYELDAVRRRAAERDAHRRYDLASAAERAARHDVDVATAAARAWAQEAEDAAVEADAATRYAEDLLRRLPRPRGGA